MKYIFFDIDGTLVSEHNGEMIIPPSTITTIQKLKENGHVVAVATGRSYQHIHDVIDVLGIGNAVCEGGNGIVINHEIYELKPLDHEIVLKLMTELDELKIPYAMQIDQNSRLYANSKMLFNSARTDFETMPIIIDENFDPQTTPCFKLFMAVSQKDEPLIKTIDASKVMRYFPDQLAFEPDDKYAGVVEFINLVKGDMKDVIFFGDGKNDISMFKQIPFSIAMGNAIDELKEMAYFVTKDINEDGIEYACQYLGLI